MEESKIINEEVTVVEEEKIVETPVAEEPVAEEAAAEQPQEEKAPEESSEEPTAEGATLTDEDLKTFADDLVNKIKALVAEGNVSRIRIRKDDTIILNLPLSVGLIGTALGLMAAPWAVILATISTIGFKCTVEVEKKDGTITVIHGKES